MTPEQMTARLLSMGFTLGEDPKAEQVKDLGFYREWLTYLKRRAGGPHPAPFQYQHLWLTSYDNRFVEAVLFVYAKPLNSRARPPMQPVHCSICRTMEEIEVAVGRVYEEGKPKPSSPTPSI